jgi:hypothetical protein
MPQEIPEFKAQMAQFYRLTYRKLLSNLTSGSVLHADETTIKLRSRKAYVWVFANLENAVYVYRPTREGEFLRKLLSKFGGVLISDFYTAYDSLNCPQQKCLTHLMRALRDAEVWGDWRRRGWLTVPSGR